MSSSPEGSHRVFVRRTPLRASADEVFRWHARPGAFERLTPPWEHVRVLERSGGIEDGARLVLGMGPPPLQIKWVAEHDSYVEGRQFRDRQVSGPFALWEHTHRIEPAADGTCVLEDHIEYRLPLGRLGDLCGGRFTRTKLERMFRYRHTVTAQDIAQHATAKGIDAMKILVTGSTGLVGSALLPFLSTGGHQPIPLLRGGQAQSGAPHWDPAAGKIAAESLEGFDAVVHLAGENIAGGRWTDDKKKKIRDSRVAGTRLLCAALAKRKRPPKTLVCASAIGYYGNRGPEVLDESSAPGSGFLAEVCQEWEAAAEPARAAGIRVVHLRIGVVLSADGGALATMLLPFKLGVGGVIGSGQQYMSWVAIDDVVGAIHFALTQDQLSGPVNAVSPSPVTNRDYTKTLGKVLARPTILPIPSFAIHLGLGEMADELLLASTRVVPDVLQEAGYEFRFPDLEPALRHLLGR